MKPTQITHFLLECDCKTLEESGYYCKLSDKYYGILVYADDIFLFFISIFLWFIQKMLDICSSFADDKGLQFNASKTPTCCHYPHFLLLSPIYWRFQKWGYTLSLGLLVKHYVMSSLT